MEKIELLGRKYDFEVHNYLYASLFRFILTYPNEVKWRDEMIILSDKKLVIELKKLIAGELEVLLTDFYQAPNHKHISKYSGRYRKIDLNGAKYTVDYTNSSFGRIVYSIFCLIQWIDNEVISKEAPET